MDLAAVVRKSADGKISLNLERHERILLEPGEIRVWPHYVGICGSDLDHLDGRTDESFGVDYPHVLGHEWSGEVCEVFDTGGLFQVGDRVIGHGSLGGNRWFGVSTNGAMAESFVVRAGMCFLVPPTVSSLQAALIEPLACALTGLRRVGGVDGGQEVLITGAGAIGLAMVALTASVGAHVTLVDPSPLRRQLAQDLGAAVVSSPEELDGSGTFIGAELCVEASGQPEAQVMALVQAGTKGRVLYMGLSSQLANNVPLNQIQNRDLTLLSSTGAPPTSWNPALKLVERSQFDLSTIVSDIFSLPETVLAVEMARDSRHHGKVVISVKVD